MSELLYKKKTKITKVTVQNSKINLGGPIAERKLGRVIEALPESFGVQSTTGSRTW